MNAICKIKQNQGAITLITIYHVSSDQRMAMSKRLAEWRVKYFREFPYLYEGNLEYENEYTSIYISDDHSGFFVAEDAEEMVGIISGVPLQNPFMTEAATIFKDTGLDPSAFYYIGEIMVHSGYRGQGIARKLMQHQEQFALDKGYTGSCFMAVERADDDPLRPEHYRNPAWIWQEAGYQKTDIKSDFEYPTIQPNGEIQTVPNTMVFWVKNLIDR